MGKCTADFAGRIMKERGTGRWFDVSGAMMLLLLLIPVIVVLILLLFFLNKGKVFFLQQRLGLQAEVFAIIKFTTMSVKKDTNGKLLPDGKRITPIGRWLRRYSLDELPQLINVLKGDMSLVGPRPLLVDYLHRYNQQQFRRHEVRPGITGWAQINGRNGISWEEKFQLDLWYIENRSLLLDLKILSKTFVRILTARDVSQSRDITMEPFKGGR